MEDNMDTLEQILELVEDEDSRVLDRHGQLRSDLPTFGGERPSHSLGAWSWDETRVLVGDGIDDLEIVSRQEWENRLLRALGPLDYAGVCVICGEG